MKDVVFSYFFYFLGTSHGPWQWPLLQFSSGRLILILSCFRDGGALQSPRYARQRRPARPAAQCRQNGGHSGCFSLVTLVIPWQRVLFGGLTEKYDMVLWLCGERSNKDGEPGWTLRWNARSISLVRVWWMHSCRAYLHTQILIWLVFPDVPAHRFLPASHICFFLFTIGFLLCIKETHSTLPLFPSTTSPLHLLKAGMIHWD